MSVLDQDINYLRTLAARGDKTAKAVVSAYDIARQDVYAPSFSSTAERIYVRSTGDNTLDGKTEETAFRTFVHAVRSAPLDIPPGKQYFFDITNLGDEVLPADFALPAWHGSRALFDFNVMIVAEHEPARALSIAERTVTVTAASANWTTKTIQVSDDSQSWTPGALKGYFLSFGDPADPLISVIYDNTADELFLSGNDGDPVVPGVGWEGTITEPSARFQTSTAESFSGFRVNGTADIYIAGIRTEDANDPEGGTSFLCQGSGLMMERSQIIGGWLSNAPRQAYFTSCYGERIFFDTRLYFSRSYVVDAHFGTPAQEMLAIHSGTVLENTSIRIGHAVTDQLNGGVAIGGVLIKDAPGDAVKMIGGTGTIAGLQVVDSQDGGNALSFIGPCKYILSSIIGTGNEGVGVFCTDGAQIECFTVSGTGGDLEFVPANEEEESPALTILTKTGAGFRVGTEAVKTIVIADATTPANNGTFPVYAVLDDETIVFGNPDGVTESLGSGTFVVDPVTVTGSDDQQVGDLSADDWPAVPFNIVDVFGGSNPNATGTGARLFNK